MSLATLIVHITLPNLPVFAIGATMEIGKNAITAIHHALHALDLPIPNAQAVLPTAT